jgi:uncharacterized protein (TIGR02145 family)
MMVHNITLNGKRFFATTMMATLALALAFTFNACDSGDTPNANTGIPPKSSCIKAELEVKFNTLDEVAVACNATRSDILSQLPNIIGSCSKNNLDFDKPIKNIEESCGAEISVVGNSSSSGGTGSSSSDGTGSSSSSSDTPSYNTKKIGDQTWMTENLNYNVAGSKCYGEDDSDYSALEVQSNCDKYGRLYDWVTAMALPSKCNIVLSTSDADCTIGSPHRGICPSGWHIPSNKEWNELYHYADGTLNGSTNLLSNYDSFTAGKHLKSINGWNSYSGIVNLDTYGFSALPGGYGASGIFLDVGDYGYWWSTSENGSYYAYSREIYYDNDYADWNFYSKRSLFSVRCVKD